MTLVCVANVAEAERRRMSADTAVASESHKSSASKAVKIVSLQAPTTERSLRQRTQSSGTANVAQTRLDYRNRPGNRNNRRRQLKYIIWETFFHR